MKRPGLLFPTKITKLCCNKQSQLEAVYSRILNSPCQLNGKKIRKYLWNYWNILCVSVLMVALLPVITLMLYLLCKEQSTCWVRDYVGLGYQYVFSLSTISSLYWKLLTNKLILLSREFICNYYEIYMYHGYLC